MRISKKHSKQNKPTPENPLEKQKLYDLEKRIAIPVGSFLVLIEEGDPQQIAFAHAQAKSEFLKFAPEMYKIASKLGGPLARAMEEYLQSVDTLLHSQTGWVDEDKMNRYYRSTQKLEAEIKL